MPDEAGVDCVTDTLAGSPPEHAVDVAFEQGSGEELPTLFQSVETYRTSAEARHVVEAVAHSIAECEDEHRSRSGVDVRLDVERVEGPSVDGVDSEVSLHARGTVSASVLSAKVGVSLTVASVGRQVTTVGVIRLGDRTAGSQLPYAATAERLLVDAARRHGTT